MRFRQIVNICHISKRTFTTIYFKNKRTVFSYVNYSSTVGNINSHQDKFVATSSRLYSYNISEEQLKKLMDQLGEQFTETRDLLEYARESIGTVYFSSDLDDAQQAVEKTLEEYNKLLETISESQKETVVRTIGLRMAELRAQLDAINESLKD